MILKQRVVQISWKPKSPQLLIFQQKKPKLGNDQRGNFHRLHKVEAPPKKLPRPVLNHLSRVWKNLSSLYSKILTLTILIFLFLITFLSAAEEKFQPKPSRMKLPPQQSSEYTTGKNETDKPKSDHSSSQSQSPSPSPNVTPSVSRTSSKSIPPKWLKISNIHYNLHRI